MPHPITRLFFANFFNLLLVCMSAAQYCIPVWLFTLFLPLFPAPSSNTVLLLPLIFFGLNITLIRSSFRSVNLPAPIRLLLRIYFAFGFITVFCLVFLVLLGAVWAVLSLIPILILTVVSAASPLQTSIPPLLWHTFRATAASGLLLLSALLLYGYLLGQKQLQISRVTLALANWPPTSPPLNIVHLSDIHIGTNLTQQELQTFVQKTNALDPDLIILTGDILDANADHIPDFFPHLNNLRARYGVFACLGNHDGYAGAQAVADGLVRYTDITLLRDRIAHLSIQATRMHLIGLDDRGKDWTRGLDSDAVLASLKASVPPNEPCILLSHRPDIFPSAAELGIDLTLSGHTHGGQFALPFAAQHLNLARFITRFPRGQYEHNNCFLYVNRGLGVAGQRIRLFTPREIALLTCGTS